MSGILCAIRGGPSSRPTIATSSQLAQETGEVIYFLYVVNLDFLTHSSSSKTNNISQEIHDMGGKSSLIGASANMITAGIAERAGYRITYKYFLKKGLPALIITVSISLVWLLIRFT